MTKKRVLLPIDGRDRSLKAIEFAMELYRPEEVEFHIINVREDVEDLLSKGNYFGAVRKGRDYLEDMTRGLKGSGYDVKYWVEFGNPGGEILQYAKRENIDLIIMTRSTKKGLYKIMGSVANDIVKKAKCMVLIVPENEN